MKKVTFAYSGVNFWNVDKRMIENIIIPLRYYHQFFNIFLAVFLD